MKKLLALVFLGCIFTLNAQENIKGRKIETKFSEGWDTTPALGTIIL